MAQDTRAEIQKTDASNTPASPERTHSGPVFSPAVDIFETENAITVLADMPGVRPETLSIDLRESVLTLTGRLAPAQSQAHEVDVLREYQSGTFYRRFTLAETIDQSKIDAKLADGVLRLELPKVERAKPRQITVRTA
jgi:HSP20 family molecular chaperone IbpA